MRAGSEVNLNADGGMVPGNWTLTGKGLNRKAEYADFTREENVDPGTRNDG